MMITDDTIPLQSKLIWYKPKTNLKVISYMDHMSTSWHFTTHSMMVKMVKMLTLMSKLDIISKRDFDWTVTGSSRDSHIVNVLRDQDGQQHTPIKHGEASI